MLSEFCRAALLNAMVLTNGDIPAGTPLIQQDTIRVTFAGQTAFPRYFSPSAQDYFRQNNIQIGTPSAISDEERAAVTRGMEQWFDVPIVSVRLHENPDIIIGTFNSINDLANDDSNIVAFGTYPRHDQEDIYATPDQLLLLLDMSDLRNGTQVLDHLGQGTTYLQILEYVTSHETGHILGLVHPERAAMVTLAQGTCPAAEDIHELAHIANDGMHDHIMSKDVLGTDLGSMEQELKQRLIQGTTPTP